MDTMSQLITETGQGSDIVLNVGALLQAIAEVCDVETEAQIKSTWEKIMKDQRGEL